MGEDDGFDTKCGGFLSEGMINRQKCKEKWDKTEEFY
jgi:hypothetical protein